MTFIASYTFDVPDEHLATVIALIPEAKDRARVTTALEGAGDGPVRLPLSLADVLLNALATWERGRGA